MKRIVKFALSFAILSVASVQGLAADNSAGLKTKMKQIMQQDPQLMVEMMGNPDHRLAMGYRNNLLTFVQVLKRAAQSSENLPGEFTRTTVSEMRRSIDLLEKEHDRAIASVSVEKKALMGEIVQLMHEHLADVRKRLDHLDQLAKGDRVVSKEVLQDLSFVEERCQMAMKGMEDRSGHMYHNDLKGRKDLDAELESLVQRMNQVSEGEKVVIMAEILTRLVETQKQMKMPMQGMAPYGMHPMMLEQLNRNSPHPEIFEDDPDSLKDDEMEMEEMD